jgi:hypothetical protein
VNGWHEITDGSPWKIYQDPDWKDAVEQGFFGGNAVLSLKILDGNGNTIMPEQDYDFRIAGENPDPTICQDYINVNNGGFWFAYAIASEETSDEGGRPLYNHFMDNGDFQKSGSNGHWVNTGQLWPGHEGRPNWNDDGTYKIWKNGIRIGRWTGSGGYGLFQLTYQAANNPNDTGDSDYVMPRDWIWNWQSNVAPAITKLSGKQNPAKNLYNWLIAKFGTSIESQRCPTDGNNQDVFTAYEGILIGMYNGDTGFTLLTPPDQSKPRRSPWQFENGNWVFTGTYTKDVAGFVQ